MSEPLQPGLSKSPVPRNSSTASARCPSRPCMATRRLTAAGKLESSASARRARRNWYYSAGTFTVPQRRWRGSGSLVILVPQGVNATNGLSFFTEPADQMLCNHCHFRLRRSQFPSGKQHDSKKPAYLATCRQRVYCSPVKRPLKASAFRGGIRHPYFTMCARSFSFWLQYISKISLSAIRSYAIFTVNLCVYN